MMGGGIGAELPLLRTVGKRIPLESFQHLFGASDYLAGKAQVAVENARKGDDDKNLFAYIIKESEKGERLDDLDVKIEAGALIAAGSDTTAVSTTYLVWAVLSRPSLQSLLEEELAGLPQDYSERELEELPILNAVIDETLRLYGAAPGGTPRSVPDGGAHLGGYYFPAGVSVTTQAYTMHRDPRIFPNPEE
jgi:cytochrome P450